MFLATAILAGDFDLEARFSDGRDPITLSVQGTDTIRSIKQKISDQTMLHPGGLTISFAGDELALDTRVDATEIPVVKEIMIQIGGFPEAIGPFSTVVVSGLRHGHFQTFNETPEQLEAELTKDGIGYQIGPDHQNQLGFFAGRRFFEQSVFGLWSPKKELTLDESIREHIGIPSSAKYVVWSYPAQVNSYDPRYPASLPPAEHDRNHIRKFFEVGAYVYLDAQNRFVGALTIVPTPDGEETALQFGEPQQWRPEWTGDLFKAGRFQPITLPFLKEQGAEWFCWINPGEQIPNGPRSEHGAFVYLFHENPLEQDPEAIKFDRIFHILDKGDDDYDEDVLEAQ